MNEERTYSIGEHLKLARKSMRLRQSDLAQMTGLPASHISDIERGASLPTIPTLNKIGSALNRPLEYFFQEITDQPRSLGMVFHEGSIGGRAASKFVELVKEKSNGAVNLRIYQRASLGSAMEQIKCLAQGGIHLYVDEPHCFEPYSDICGVVFLPYFFNDRSHYYRFLESSIYENEIYQPLLQSGIRILNPRFYWEGGNFELLFSREPIFTPEDLKGKKIRTYSSKVAIELRNALGAKAVVVEWENVCDAFERGDIEVLLCPASYFSALQLHKVVKHATILRYGYTANLNVAMSEKEYIKLRPSIQQALVDAVETTGIYCSELANKQTEVDLVNLSARFGVPVIQPDATLWQSAFKKAIHHVCNKGFLDKGIYKNIQGL